MVKYKIEIKKSAAKEIQALPSRDIKHILQVIESLSNNPRPHGCEKLTNREEYRIRYGHYRIIYTIEDVLITVCIVKAGHRKDIYR